MALPDPKPVLRATQVNYRGGWTADIRTGFLRKPKLLLRQRRICGVKIFTFGTHETANTISPVEESYLEYRVVRCRDGLLNRCWPFLRNSDITPRNVQPKGRRI